VLFQILSIILSFSIHSMMETGSVSAIRCEGGREGFRSVGPVRRSRSQSVCPVVMITSL
jgi:hypothetical protein